MPCDIITIPGRFSSSGYAIQQYLGISGSGLSMQVLEGGDLAWMGGQGQVFGITQDLTGLLMGVYDIAGLPILEVSSDDKLVAGTFGASAFVVSGRRVGVGTASPLYTLDVTGLSRFAGGLIANGISLYPAFTGDFTQTSGAASFSALKQVSGALASTISVSAAGVSMFNGLSGALNLGTAPAPANYVTFSTSGSTFWLSGLANPTFTSATFAKDSAATTNATALWTNAAGAISYADAGIDTSNNFVLRTRAAGAGTLTTALSIASGTFLASFTSGVQLGITGDYTTNRAASVAQLLAVSGILATSAGGVPAARVVIPVTGNFAITGGNTNAYNWTGIATYGGTLPQPSVYSGMQLIVKNLSRTSNLILSGTVDYDTNYTLIPRAGAILISDAASWNLI